MDFTVRGQAVSLDVTSVILEYNPKTTESIENLILWHCPICNQPLFQYSARLVMIIPGMTPTKLPLILICPKCKKRYLINSIVEGAVV